MNKDINKIYENYLKVVEEGVQLEQPMNTFAAPAPRTTPDPLKGTTGAYPTTGANDPLKGDVQGRQAGGAAPNLAQPAAQPAPVDPMTGIDRLRQEIDGIEQMPNDETKTAALAAAQQKVNDGAAQAAANKQQEDIIAQSQADGSMEPNPYAGSTEKAKEWSDLGLRLATISRSMHNQVANTNPPLAEKLEMLFGENWKRLDQGLDLIFEHNGVKFVL